MTETPVPAPAPRIEVHVDAADLATAVAGELIARLEDAQARGEEPQIGLTGGSIADAVHRELGRMGPASEVDWQRVVVWWGDERFVAPDSPDRNAEQARAAGLDLLDARPGEGARGALDRRRRLGRRGRRGVRRRRIREHGARRTSRC